MHRQVPEIVAVVALRGVLVVLVCLIGLAVPVAAEMPAGHDDPRFQVAVEAWLDANDEGSLPVLAMLAREGNTAAQVLLARIRFQTKHNGPWVESLSFKERRELFREPALPFGRSWLFAASETSALARALNDSRADEVSKDTLPALVALGEKRAAFDLALRLVGSGRGAEVLEVLDGLVDDPYLIRAAWVAAIETGLTPKNELPRRRGQPWLGGDDGPNLAILENWEFSMVSGADLRLVSRRVNMTGEASQSDFLWVWMGALFDPEVEPHEAFVQAVAETHEARPLATLCKRRCPGSFLRCFRMGHWASGGLYRQGRLGSSVETLVPGETYRASVRAGVDVIDLMRLLGALDRIGKEGSAASRDQCLANLIEERSG